MPPEAVPSSAAGCHALSPYAFFKECIRQVGCDKSAAIQEFAELRSLSRSQPSRREDACKAKYAIIVEQK